MLPPFLPHLQKRRPPKGTEAAAGARAGTARAPAAVSGGPCLPARNAGRQAGTAALLCLPPPLRVTPDKSKRPAAVCAAGRMWRAGRRSAGSALVEGGVVGVEVLRVQIVLYDAKRVAEALEVRDFPRAQEADRVAHVRVVGEAEDVVVGQTRLLLGRKVLVQVGDGVAGGLEGQRRKRLPRSRDRIDAGRVVDEVGVEARFLNLRRREVARELVDDRADHLHMRQFLGAYIVLRNVPY